MRDDFESEVAPLRQEMNSDGGLSVDRIRTVSYGEAPDRLVIPSAAGPGAAGRENRRAVIVFDHPVARHRLATQANAS